MPIAHEWKFIGWVHDMRYSVHTRPVVGDIGVRWRMLAGSIEIASGYARSDDKALKDAVTEANKREN